MPTPLVLHIWPGRWDLPSIDAACLEAVLFLQLSCPGHFAINETTDPDLSPSGQLPFLTHGSHAVASVSSIISYVSGLAPDAFLLSEEEDGPICLHIDAGLPSKSLAQRPAWRAYIETQLGDLVAHSFWVLDPNYAFTHRTYVSMLSVPQRYYVPRRIRESYKPRLESAGLWNIAATPEPQEKQHAGKQPFHEAKEKMKRAFGQAQLTEKAKSVFNILGQLVDQKYLLSGDRPTTVDLTLASRILLLTYAPLPNPALKELLIASYPSLISHSRRVEKLAFADLPPLRILEPPQVNPLQIFQSTVKGLIRRVTTQELESDLDKEYRWYRWGMAALAIVSLVTYQAAVGPRIVIASFPRETEEKQEPEPEKEPEDEETEALEGTEEGSDAT